MSASWDPFDPFTLDNWQENGESTTEADPWSSGAWGRGVDFQNTALDTTFDSAGLFDINLAPSSDAFSVADDASSLLFPGFESDAVGATNALDDEPTIQVAIHEQLSCLYDGTASSGHVDGSIHVRPSDGTPESFALLIHDSCGHIEKLEEDAGLCQDISTTRDLVVDGQDYALRVSIPLRFNPMSPIARYRCTSEVYPIPLLVKSKVHVLKNVCRVQIKIRGNPANQSTLTDVAIILAVPPDVSGESAKMSQAGGVWDGMKRLVAWSVGEMEPGQMIELKVQFKCVAEEDAHRTVPKFPILARCAAVDELFSGVSLSAADEYDLTSPAKVNVSRTVRILHRKV